MSSNSFFSYIHPSILIIDLRTRIPQVQEFYAKHKTKVIHELVYETDLPKRLEMHDAHDSNPYHLLFYMVARFYYLDNGTTEIPYYYEKRDRYLVEAALSALPPRFQRRVDKEEGLEYISFPGCSYGIDFVKEDWMYSYIKDLYKHLWEKVPRQKGKRIFISREFAGERRLAMSQTFVRQLLTLGFSIYCLETMSFQDQVQLFHSADIVCGPHGAGLTWITFCEPGTLVCELCPFMKGKGHYKHICDSMGFHYAHLFMCSLEGEKEEFKVDDLEFFRTLGHLVEQYTSSA